MELKDLVGPHQLSGVDSGILRAESLDRDDINTLLFTLDGVTYLVHEDPCDGYRSYFGTIEVVDNQKVANTFPPVGVIAEWHEDSTQEMLEFTDVLNDAVILRVGTCNTDDYYPYYVGHFVPENMSVNERLN